MSNLAFYHQHLQPGRTYDEQDLAHLQIVFDRACAELGLAVEAPERETVATLLFHVATGTENLDDLLNRLLSYYRQGRC